MNYNKTIEALTDMIAAKAEEIGRLKYEMQKLQKYRCKPTRNLTTLTTVSAIRYN